VRLFNGEMQTRADAELLRDYAENARESAFREIVARYADLVYSSALRQVASPDLARDVAQSVFTDLARKAAPLAKKLAENSSLVGWLYRSTRFAALNLIRDGRRRVAQERQAMEQLIINSESAPDWERVGPLLDQAMEELKDEEREVLLLRYFKQLDFHAVGHAVGVSDDAAQKRVSRAVERLRELFAKRGMAVGAGGLAAVISANAVHAAPAGLWQAIAANAVMAGTTTAATAAATTTMNWINIKSIAAIITSVVAAGTITHVIEQKEASRLRDANQQLVAQQQTLTSEKDQALAAVAAKIQEQDRPPRDQSELLRLRGEVAQLRAQQKELAQVRAENQRLRSAAPARAVQTQNVQAPDANGMQCINQLRQIDGAMQQCALENRLSVTNIIIAEQILPYFKGGELPRCPGGGTYSFGNLTNPPTCSIPGHTISSTD
jgi:RNA polymerase sigma factor (sigma-70 family)